MKRRRRSDAALPRSPLELSYPLEVRGPGMEGAAILDEVPPDAAPFVLKALRLVYAWSRGPELAGPLLRRDELALWEREVAAAGLEDGLWEPLVTIAAGLKRPERAGPDEIAKACFVVSEWALGKNAESTALLFAEAAALAWPEHARYAWIVGRMLRNHGHPREAEIWLRRAARVAVWCDDWETQDLALNSLGNLFAQQGSFSEALHYLTRALKLAQRQSMKEREGAVTHDLFLVSIYTGKYAQAEQLACCTFELYDGDHPNLPKLAHDVAYLWSEQGRFQLALPVLRALLPFFRVVEERILVLGAMARAAGACGERELFERVWTEAWELMKRPSPVASAFAPPGLFYLGLGAASLGEWERAAEALSLALEKARERQAHDDITKACAALEMVRRHKHAEHSRHPVGGRMAAQLADAFVRTLERSVPGSLDAIEPVCGRGT
jgi:tetratricopeptide (TPR) repeat protein